MAGKAAEHNARQVERYLDIWPAIAEPPGRGEAQIRLPSAPRPASSAPVSSALFAFLADEDNRDASRILSPLLEELRKSGASYGGISFRGLLDELLYDPAAIRRWKAARGGRGAKKARALAKMCALIARAIAARYGEERLIHVRLPRACHPARNLHDAAMKRRTWKKEDSYRILANEWAEMVARGIDESEAYRTVAKAHDTSYWRVWRAVEWAKEDAG